MAGSEGGGVFRSDDNGQTWKNIGLEGRHLTDIRFDRADPQRLWACARPYKDWLGGKMTELKPAFSRSDDGGQTWKTLVDDGPSEILQDPVDSKKLYGIWDNHVKISSDRGETWQDGSDGLPAKGGGYNDEGSFQALAAGPDFVVTASTKGTFYTLPHGQTHWQKIVREGLTENYDGQPWAMTGMGRFGSALGSITVDPRDRNHWFFTDWFSIYQTPDAGKHWRLSIDGIESTVLHCLTQDPSDPGVVHLGMADNGYFLSENGGVRFHSSEGISNNVKCISLSPKLPNRVYAVGPQQWDWWTNQVFVSLDRGHHWTRSPMLGLPDMSKHHCNTIAVDPSDPYTVYLGVSQNVEPNGGGVYKSVDGGKTWTAMSQGLPAGQNFFTHDIWSIGRELAVSPNGSIVAISHDHAQVFHWNAANKAWAAATTAPMGKPNDLAIDPRAPQTFYLGSDAGIWRSSDGGAAWTKLWAGDIPHFAVDLARPSRLAAGTSDGEGVILSNDSGKTWTKTDDHLPYRVNNLVAFAGDRLIAGSEGSGTFWLPLSPTGKQPLTARPIVVATVPGAVSTAPALLNGSMTEGTTTPTGWGTPWSGTGKVQAARDTQVYKTGPASLRLESVGGTAYGSVSQSFTPTLEPFTVSGWVKTSGKLDEALVAVQAFDASGKQVDFITLGNGVGATDWKAFSGQVQLPKDADHCNLVLTLKGNGKVWLDEVQTSSVPRVFL